MCQVPSVCVFIYVLLTHSENRRIDAYTCSIFTRTCHMYLLLLCRSIFFYIHMYIHILYSKVYRLQCHSHYLHERSWLSSFPVADGAPVALPATCPYKKETQSCITTTFRLLPPCLCENALRVTKIARNRGGGAGGRK